MLRHPLCNKPGPAYLISETAEIQQAPCTTAITLYNSMKNIQLTLAVIGGTAWGSFAQTSSTLSKD